VDGGAHEGETIEHFKRTNLYKKHTWTIFAFEANPNLIPDLPKAPDVTVLNQAICNRDGTIEFCPGDWFGVKVGDFRRYGVVFFGSLLMPLLIFRLLGTRKRARDANEQA
jgi:hypothetical protein